MSYRVKLLICYISVLLLSACGEQAPQNGRFGATQADASIEIKTVKGPKNAEEADTLVLALGDSLYAGYQLDRGEGFPEELQNALVDNGVNAFVANAGVSGDTSAAGRERLQFALDGLPRKPDLVVMGLGGNDMLRGIEPEQTRVNLEAMLKNLSDQNIPVVLTGMLAAPNLGPDYAGQFNPIFPELAKRYNAALYPFFMQEVVGKREFMLSDGIHPNAEGVDRITADIAPVVLRKLQEKKAQ